MSRWTPGPWCILPGSFTMVVAGGAGNRRTVASACRASSKTDEQRREDRANAQLITAAPDLFEALEDCLHFGQLADPDLRKQVELALAKAQGEAKV